VQVDGPVLQQLLFFALLLFGGYVIAIRPQRVRARALAQVRASLAPGRRVMTSAGLHATVVAVEGDVAVLEVAPGVHLRFADAAVVRLLDEPTGPVEPTDRAE
jgi:preprotein translocase subunit YajC